MASRRKASAKCASGSKPGTATQRGGLRRVLGFPALLFYGLGLILGAGVYSVIGEAAGLAGRGLWLAFVGGAVVAGLTGLSYAELSTMYPKAGAEYVYAGKAFPRHRALPAGTGLLLAASVMATAATVAVGFGGYLRQFVEVPVWAGAAGLLALCTAVNVLGVRHAAGANIAMTLVEAAGLLLVVWAGWGHVEVGKAFVVPEWTGAAAAAALVFFAFLGFEDIANLAEEAKDPGRHAPWAILGALAAATALYVLVAITVVAVVPPGELAGSQSPLSDAVAHQGPRWPPMLAAIALVATANTALVTMVAGSRMLYGLARGGDLPAAFARVLPRRGTPWVAAAAALVLSLAVLPLGGVAMLGSVASLGALVAFIVVDVSVIRLRFTKPGVARPFRVPLAVGKVPVLPVLGALGALAFALALPAKAHLIGLAMAALAFGTWWLLRRHRRRTTGAKPE